MVRYPVIITRTEPGASETARRLAAEGHVPVLSPMLDLRRSVAPLPDLSGFDHLIFTSANGVAFLMGAAGGVGPHLTAWCVGPSTAGAARAAGFSRVMESAGDGEDLAAFILSAPEGSVGRFLHVANAAARGEIVARLQGAGRDVTFMALYEAVPARALSEAAAETLREGPAIILVHSARGAEAFVAAAEGVDLSPHVCVGISPRAIAPLQAAGCGVCHTAETPNEDALFAALNRLC